MLTILGGAPGCGKTTIAIAAAAVITRGGTWPDGTRCTHPGDVLVWSGEDPASVTAARMKASGADLSRVHFIDGISGSDGEAFDPGRDMPLLEAKAETLPAPRLLILDPIVSAVAGDSHKGAEVRRSLQPVVALGQRLGCAVLGMPASAFQSP
jgi:putative DNA primase/helicase